MASSGYVFANETEECYEDNTKEVLKHFIETFKSLPVLWDTSHQSYTNKSERGVALDILAKIYRKIKRGASRYDVQKKINSLRSNYRKELRKMAEQNSKNNGRVYKPTSWVFYTLSFLPVEPQFKYNVKPKLEPESKEDSDGSLTPTSSRFTKKVKREDSPKGEAADASERAVNFSERYEDDAQIFGDFIVSSLRDLATNWQRQRLKTMISKALLNFEDGQPIMRSQSKDNESSNMSYSNDADEPTSAFNNESVEATELDYNEEDEDTYEETRIKIEDDDRTITELSPVKTSQKRKRYKGNTSGQQKQSIMPPSDESRIPAIAKAWGEKLLTLEHTQRIFAEKAINDVLFEASLGTLQRGSVAINKFDPLT